MRTVRGVGNTAEVLLVSPLGQAEEMFGVGKENIYSDRLNEVVNILEKKHISYHVTNANILRAYGSAEDQNCA